MCVWAGVSIRSDFFLYSLCHCHKLRILELQLIPCRDRLKRIVVFIYKLLPIKKIPLENNLPIFPTTSSSSSLFCLFIYNPQCPIPQLLTLRHSSPSSQAEQPKIPSIIYFSIKLIKICITMLNYFNSFI